MSKRIGIDSPKYSTFGKKDPLSYGPKLNSSVNTFPKYETKIKGSIGATVGGTVQKLHHGAFGRGGAKEIKIGEENSMEKVNIKRGVQDYETLKKKCLEANILFEDKKFPAQDSSLYYNNAGKQNLVWKRPTEIAKNPKFFVDGVSRFDVKQGELGNCWFLAAVGNLTIYEDLFYQVVPKDNTFDVDYCGIFHFRFWQYGTWIDVVVDDFLPCHPVSGDLCFMHSYEKNEFWGALMEKAYAKVYGSYQALDGGTSTGALQDFSGGIVEVYMIKTCEQDVAQLIETSFQRHSFICCAVEGHAGIKEAVTSDGIVHGHAYTITAFKHIDIAKPRKTTVTLIRIRNPWGSDTEWNGAWSDGSKEWSLVSEEIKRSLDLVDRKDGEFWMSIADFKNCFDKLDICNLSPSLYKGVAIEGKKWNESDFNGKWVPYATSGGCSNYIFNEPYTYANNPQFIVEFDTPDDFGDQTKCTVLISLLQKNRRAKKKEGANSLSIGYSLYSLNGVENVTNPLDLNFFKTHSPIGSSGTYLNSRVVNSGFELTPGSYCIVPSTFKPNEDGEFIIRVFSESKNNITENGGITEMDDVEEEDKDNSNLKLSKEDEIKASAISKLFDATSGDDQEIGWEKLKQLLDTYLKREFKFNGFSSEVCRSMVALMDKDRSGKLGSSEFKVLWTSILIWKNTFKKFDEDHSNSMSICELRKALKFIGIRLSNKTLETIVLRYGNDNGLISFEDFIMCNVKLSAMIGTFKEYDSPDSKTATFDLENWLQKTIYS